MEKIKDDWPFVVIMLFIFTGIIFIGIDGVKTNKQAKYNEMCKGNIYLK